VGAPEYADIILAADGRELLCHRAVLFSRCPRLRAMAAFEGRFTEPQEGDLPRVDISGVSGMTAALARGLVLYLYTDHVQVAPHLVGRLGRIGTLLGLGHLTSLCQRRTGEEWEEGERRDVEGERESRFARDLRKLLKNSEYGDVEFDLLDGECPVVAHKALLIQRCPYFERLFGGGFRESGDIHSHGRLQTVKLLQKVSRDVFIDLLTFLYTGGEDLFTPENVVPLLAAADSFMVDDLQQQCIALIEGGLDIENASSVLILGDQYNAPRLVSSAIDFAVATKETVQAVAGTAAFQQLQARHMPLLRRLDYVCARRGLLPAGALLRGAEMAT